MVVKNQHIIPAIYLKHFSLNPQENRRKRKILSIDINNTPYKIEEKKIDKVAVKKHFYSISRNEQHLKGKQKQYDYFVENHLASEFENEWDNVVEEIARLANTINPFNKVQTINCLELSARLKKLISSFFWRAEARRIEIECFLKLNNQNADGSELKEAVRIHHLREMGLMAGRTFLSLTRKKIFILVSKKPVFIASDNPVIVMDNDPYTRSDILNPKSIIYCAITPKIAVVIYPDYRYQSYSINDLEKIINLNNTGDTEDIVSKLNNVCNTIELKFADYLHGEFQKRLVAIEANDWLFSNNHDLLKECLGLMPERAKERPKITNSASIFVPSRVNFFNECLKDA